MNHQENIIKEMLSYFNLISIPFDKEIKTSQLIAMTSVQKTLQKIQYLLALKGIGILTGKSGTGKTCILRLLKESLPSSIFNCIYICHSSVSVIEFYYHIANALGLTLVGRKASLFRAIKERIELLSKTNIHSVLLLDEAQFLSPDILLELRLLCNFDMDSTSRITILLCGQEELNQKFGLSSLEFLSNSLSVSVNIQGLPAEETFSYLEKRISDCGCSRPIFTKNAMSAIHQITNGNLRLINTVAMSCLIKAFSLKHEQVEAEHVQSVISR